MLRKCPKDCSYSSRFGFWYNSAVERSHLGLAALTLGAFAIGTTEFVPVGLLPQIAQSLDVSIPTAGFLVTGYALAVALGAPALTIAFNGLPRKVVLGFLMALFIAGNALAGVAPNYGVLLGARIVTALCHGTFFGVGALVASSMVPKERSAAAISTMFTGLTLATVLGVPFGTFIGDRFGWHAPFALIALLGVAALIGIWILVPHVVYEATDLRVELRALISGRLALALGTTMLGFAGVFTLFTYIAPLLEMVTGFSAAAVSGLLVLFGAGTTVGNILAGRYADRSLPATLITTLLGLSVTLALSTIAWSNPLGATLATFAIGFFGFATVTPLQLLVIRASGKARNLASSVNISAFNIGNALGAALGGAVVASGAPLPTIGVVAAIVALGGTLLAIVGMKRPGFVMARNG
jgi:MFS transporter, DHA1 family, inner membrane transport protein